MSTVLDRTVPTGTTTPAAGPFRSLRHAGALAVRNLLKTVRTPEALIDVTIQPIIFLLLFTYIFGGALGGGDRSTYLQYLLPGILAQSISLAGVSLGQNLNSDIQKGVFDRFRSLPIARSAPLVGAVLADVVRYLILFAVIMTAATVMGFRVQTGFWPTLAALGVSMAFALSFCWISVYVGLLVRTPGAVQGLMFLLVMPLSFGSNVFVDTASMPGWLQHFVHVNPITHLVGVVRGLMLGGPVAGDLAWTGGWIAVFLAVFVPLALRAYNRRA
ncbi:ABC transporter permease [Kineococcus sp. DHX-1]|uniref:ABC transporter permease n=1 Tax=Kineococcus sp. DHX-1 TaxID=3349638 RepID=UPI0036D36D6F